MFQETGEASSHSFSSEHWEQVVSSGTYTQARPSVSSRLTLRVNYYSTAFVSQLSNGSSQHSQGVNLNFLFGWSSLLLTQKNHRGVGEPSGVSTPSGYCNQQVCDHLLIVFQQKSIFVGLEDTNTLSFPIRSRLYLKQIKIDLPISV